MWRWEITSQHFLDREDLVIGLFSGLIELSKIGHDGCDEIRHRLSLPPNGGRSFVLSPTRRALKLSGANYGDQILSPMVNQ